MCGAIQTTLLRRYKGSLILGKSELTSLHPDQSLPVEQEGVAPTDICSTGISFSFNVFTKSEWESNRERLRSIPQMIGRQSRNPRNIYLYNLPVIAFLSLSATASAPAFPDGAL